MLPQWIVSQAHSARGRCGPVWLRPGVGNLAHGQGVVVRLGQVARGGRTVWAAQWVPRFGAVRADCRRGPLVVGEVQFWPGDRSPGERFARLIAVRWRAKA